MKKSNIEVRYYQGEGSNPAINVKVHQSLYPYVAKVVERFKCSEEQAEQALEFAYNMAQRDFWEDAKELVKDIFPEGTMYQSGRSGGWLTVHGLPDVDGWDATMVARWSKLERHIKADIQVHLNEADMLDNIERNKWYIEGAEEDNFQATEPGKFICIAEMKQEAIKAGFGAVVRR